MVKNKTASALCALAIIASAVSCEKEPLQERSVTDNIVVTASIADGATKTSYEDTGSQFIQTWTTDDQLFGFVDGVGTPVAFNVTEVDSESRATLSQITSVSLAGKTVHLIYYPGKSTADLNGCTLSVDLSSQSAESVPAIMLSTATESDGALSFSFTNACAIIGVKDPVISSAASQTVTALTLSSHAIVAEGVIEVSDGSLVLTPAAPSKFVSKTINATTDGSGLMSGAWYIATIPCTTTADYPLVLTATYTADGTVKTNSLALGGKTIAASNYYLLKEKTLSANTLPHATVTVCDLKWADRNLCATSASSLDGHLCYGDYYAWGSVRKIYTSRDGTSLTGLEAGGFCNANTPYWDGTSAYTKYNSAAKTVLDPVDDIVQITYPASGWRMPTSAEFQALRSSASTWGWDGTYKGRTFDFGGGAYLWFPASGRGMSSGLNYTGTDAEYWTSSVDKSNYTRGIMMYFTSGNIYTDQWGDRAEGCVIRPVSD